jgi:hypothetical protein
MSGSPFAIAQDPRTTGVSAASQLFTCVHASKAACRLKSGRRNSHWFQRELQKRYERAQNEKRIKNNFEHAAAFFFLFHLIFIF